MIDKEKLKTWIVNIFIRVEREPLYKVVIAKLVYKYWKGFKEA